MKIATWNVNGIRARAAQLCEWLARDQPDVVCLQELKAESVQIPEACKLPEYHVYWHCMRAYSGVSLHIRSEICPAAPAFTHPEFDMESRIVTAQMGNTVFASVYVPNGGKDYPAKLRFLESLTAWIKRLHAEGRELVLCGDINIARTEMDVHPRERKPVIGQLNTAINKAIRTDKVREALAKLGVDPVGGSPEAFGTLMHSEIAHWSKVIRDAGIKINS